MGSTSLTVHKAANWPFGRGVGCTTACASTWECWRRGDVSVASLEAIERVKIADLERNIYAFTGPFFPSGDSQMRESTYLCTYIGVKVTGPIVLHGKTSYVSS